MDSYIRRLFKSDISEEYLLNFRKLISFLLRANSKNITLRDGTVPLNKNLLICIYGKGSSGKSFFLNFIMKHFPNHIQCGLIKMIMDQPVKNNLSFEDKYIVDRSGSIFEGNLPGFLVYNPDKLPLKKILCVIDGDELNKFKKYITPIYFPNTFEYDENFHEETDRIDPNEVQNYFDVPVEIEELEELQNFFTSQ